MPGEQSLSPDAARQGELWGHAVRDWCEVMEPNLAPLWNAALDAVAVTPGMRLLDAGCGTGGASVLAVSRGALVSSFDASTNSVAVASERLHGHDVRIGDLQAIPYDDAAFDAAIAINSVQFASDPAKSLRELRRVVKPGGRVCVVVWASPEKSDQKLLIDAVLALYPEPPRGQGAMALARAGELDAVAREAGLEIASDREIELRMRFDSVESALRGQLSTGPTIRAMSILGHAPVEQAIESVLRRLQREGGGIVELSNRFRCAILS